MGGSNAGLNVISKRVRNPAVMVTSGRRDARIGLRFLPAQT
jgi:hypothetical protein